MTKCELINNLLLISESSVTAFSQSQLNTLHSQDSFHRHLCPAAGCHDNTIFLKEMYLEVLVQAAAEMSHTVKSIPQT